MPIVKILLGIGLVCLLHGLGLLLSLQISSWRGDYFFIVFIAGVGLIQAIYVLPLLWLLRRLGQAELLKGVLLGAGLTLLIGGVCWAGMGISTLV